MRIERVKGNRFERRRPMQLILKYRKRGTIRQLGSSNCRLPRPCDYIRSASADKAPFHPNAIASLSFGPSTSSAKRKSEPYSTFYLGTLPSQPINEVRPGLVA